MSLPSPTRSTPIPARGRTSSRPLPAYPTKHSVIVAHSLGCLTALRHLRSQRGAWRLGTLVLVAGFTEHLPALPDLDSYIGDGCDLDGLSDHIDHIVVLRSDNDPLVLAELTDRLADQLGVRTQVVPGAGHFLATDGFTTLPDAVDAVRG